jgi:hypothetical protein
MNRNILVLPLQRPMQELPNTAIYYQEHYNAKGIKVIIVEYRVGCQQQGKYSNIQMSEMQR